VKRPTILVIENAENVRMLLRDILTWEGYKVTTAADGEQGIEAFKKKAFDLVFTDLGMPGMTGWDVAKAVKDLNPATVVVLVTGWDIQLDSKTLKKKGVDAVVRKPFREDEILGPVRTLMARGDKTSRAEA
jgi:CheY-like chemotaxis protein